MSYFWNNLLLILLLFVCCWGFWCVCCCLFCVWGGGVVLVFGFLCVFFCCCWGFWVLYHVCIANIWFISISMTTIVLWYFNTILLHTITGCIPPNKIPQTTLVSGAITDAWNVSIYIYIMDINTTAPHLWNKSQKMGRWAAHFWD